MRVEIAQDPSIGEYDRAVAIANRFYWNLSAVHRDEGIRLFSGDQLVARFASAEHLEAFVAGMALALSVLPASAVEEIDRVVGE